MMKIKLLTMLLLLLTSGLVAQKKQVTLSGTIKDKNSGEALSFVTVVLKQSRDTTQVTGTISNEAGQFTLRDVASGEYWLSASFVGYDQHQSDIFVGSNSAYLDLGVIDMTESAQQLQEVIVTGEQDAVSGQMDKKTFTVEDNVSQGGGSVMQSMQNLPGVTTQEGQIALRGNTQVMVLIDGKQTAITGFGNQNGLDNIPASAVEKIEIINNPSAKYDTNGNGGIINIIMKKEEESGLNGKVGLTTGLGALWIRKDNLPGIRPQYQATPKINPSLSLNYRKKNVNFFLQADNLYTETLNKNEFVTRTYDDGTVIHQQMKRNRNTNFFSATTGMDWYIDEHNSLTVSGMFSQESIKDYGDQPFFDEDYSQNLRLWQFLEDEVLTAAMLSVAYAHKFAQPGEKLNIGFNYTFDREDEKYFFDNTMPAYTTEESFFLIADQRVADISLDYTRPTKHGLWETGVKFRSRAIPTDMQFNSSSSNSVLDPGADGKATYKEMIPAIYGNYLYEIKHLEAEVGLRVEYVNLVYEVDPNHNTYASDGYDYFQPFPNARITYNVDARNKLSMFYNRRVDRPDEGDIRIFPKYDDAEIIKVGNPALRPQFTNSFELGYKNVWDDGYYYGAVYHRMSDGTITRIATQSDTSNLIYNISQNAGKSYNSGVEMVLTQDLTDWLSMNLNINGYYNKIDAFTAVSQYPKDNSFTVDEQDVYSGNVKLNTAFSFFSNLEAQLTAIYLAPDIIPQGTIGSRFSLDIGVKKGIQKGKGELFFNATDVLNTMVIHKEIEGDTFSYTSSDYYETQVFRLGYNFKF
ncbi:TonB-dependent receptor family protein [Reichenbachiella carrageenanivorans]|uniref:TonB-dependent receptor family protein n=1 Tax=Reichenbachiella carrageenanivorans TaxID=2979869 RepID=A0ABY6CXN6_9BACT|nr:outer membrane beta-barrel family protein [Reichenbachiella carrageenanivorans]UXX78686.1 TonB-dependent receptor family protein [Reichenbachiella carrageenanivorans]